MIDTDSIRRGDEISVTIWGPDNSCLYKSTGNDYHSLDDVINDTLSKAHIEINPEDCVFEISNISKGVTHKYRINAHGHLKLIV